MEDGAPIFKKADTHGWRLMVSAGGQAEVHPRVGARSLQVSPCFSVTELSLMDPGQALAQPRLSVSVGEGSFSAAS